LPYLIIESFAFFTAEIWIDKLIILRDYKEVMFDKNIFNNGLEVDIATLRKGAKTTDCHIFINNKLYAFLNEIQINYEDKFDKKILRSRLVNIAVMQLCDDLIRLPDADALEYVKNLDTKYKDNFN